MSSVVNRTGVIALGVVAAIVAWGALHKDTPDPATPPAARTTQKHSQRSADGGSGEIRDAASSR